MSKLIEDIKLHEGFVPVPYDDSLGFETIGYGTKLPLTEEEAELLLVHRLNKTISEVNTFFYNFELEDEAMNILYDMAYNMGISRLRKFKRMIEALKNKDYLKASEEMIDSLWYRQVGSRAKKLVERMKDLA